MVKKSNSEIFPGIGKIKYEGKDSKNPLAFRWYDAEAKVGAVSYTHLTLPTNREV